MKLPKSGSLTYAKAFDLIQSDRNIQQLMTLYNELVALKAKEEAAGTSTTPQKGSWTPMDSTAEFAVIANKVEAGKYPR